MKSFNKKEQEKEFSFQKLAASPLISAILLIALVIVAGALTAAVLWTTINEPPTVSLDEWSITSPSSKDGDTNVDRLLLHVENTGTYGVTIQTSSLRLIDALTESPLSLWRIDTSDTTLFISGREGATFVIYTLSSSSGDQPFPGSYVLVEFDAYPTSVGEEAVDTYSSPPMLIKDTIGPVSVIDNSADHSFNPNVSIQLLVQNNGTGDLNARIELSCSTPAAMNFYNNTSEALDSVWESVLPGASSPSALSSVTISDWVLLSTTSSQIGTTYFVFVTVWNADTLKILAQHSFAFSF